MSDILLHVNGRRHAVDVEPGTPLLWVLRDTLDLTGTKYGCGAGICGACTVHVDGEPVRSCVTTLHEVGAKRVTTIEGLAADPQHPLLRAWIEDEVSQCGYCQPGQIMRAAALLASRPRPSDDEITKAMEDMLCRCGTYSRIRRAIRRAAAEGGRP